MDERQTVFYRFSALLGLLGLLALVAAVVAMTAAGTITRPAMALYVVAAVLLALFVAPRVEEIGELLSTRSARQGSNVVAFSMAIIGILVVLNVLAVRYPQQIDITAARQFTLSDQTLKVIKQIKQPIRITAFYTDDDYLRGPRDLLSRYAHKSPFITVKFVDPFRQRVAAEQAGIRAIPATLFEMGKLREETTGLSEQDFTSALLKLTRPEKKKVYFLTGHNERDPEGLGQDGYSDVAAALRRENYEVTKLSLISDKQVAEDAALVVIAAPRAPLLAPEIKALRTYLDNGGKLLVLSEPREEVGLNTLLAGWGVTLRDDLVVDPGRFVRDPRLVVPKPQFGHRISSTLPEVTIFSLTRSLAIEKKPPEDLEIRPLLRTSDRAWGETNFESQHLRFDAEEDQKGPLTLAVAVNRRKPPPKVVGGLPAPTPTPALAPEAPQPKGRVVVFGDSDFAANGLLREAPTNLDVLVNSVDWLAEEEDLISIRATPAEAPRVALTNEQSVVVGFITVFCIPLVVLLTGTVIWWQRR